MCLSQDLLFCFEPTPRTSSTSNLIDCTLFFSRVPCLLQIVGKVSINWLAYISAFGGYPAARQWITRRRITAYLDLSVIMSSDHDWATTTLLGFGALAMQEHKAGCGDGLRCLPVPRAVSLSFHQITA